MYNFVISGSSSVGEVLQALVYCQGAMSGVLAGDAVEKVNILLLFNLS